MAVTASRPLTSQQESFVINYIKNGFNVYSAAVSAGYSDYYARAGCGARMLLKRPWIQDRLQAVVNASTKRYVCTFDWKVTQLHKLIVSSIDGDAPNKMVALKALDVLNKMQGDYAPAKVLSVTVKATQDKLKEVRQQYADY